MSDWQLHLDMAKPLEDAMERVAKALVAAEHGGMTDGAHHKQWALDQIARALTGVQYREWLRFVTAGDDGPDTYAWDEGVAP